jgi:branched-chain amino acid transport system permease protein
MILRENENKWTYAGIGIVLLVLVLLPWIISGYWVRLLTAVFMFAVTAKAIDLMMGYTGYVPFGNVVFFGLGAYTTGILMSRGWAFIPGMLIGVLISIFVCIVFGIPVLRLRGHYFAIATIGLNGAIMAVALNATGLTGGAMGIIFPPLEMDPAALNRIFYFIMMGLMILAAVVNIVIVRSRFGFAIRSIKSNEEAARSLGINTTFYKTTSWIISATITSVAGSVYGWWMSYISTVDVFNVMIAVTSILMVLLGGAGTILGPIVGAFIFQLLSEVVWSQFLTFHLGILGVLTMLVILFVPRGLVVAFTELIGGKPKRRRKETAQ